MKLVRYGPAGAEKPGLIDQDGKLRDLSRKIDDVDGDVSVWSLMGNVLWNPSIGDRWNAYVGGGIGWVSGRFSHADLSGPFRHGDQHDIH